MLHFDTYNGTISLSRLSSIVEKENAVYKVTRLYEYLISISFVELQFSIISESVTAQFLRPISNRMRRAREEIATKSCILSLFLLLLSCSHDRQVIWINIELCRILEWTWAAWIALVELVLKCMSLTYIMPIWMMCLAHLNFWFS